ncbi:MAG: EAL domain-containing protein [Desulfuromonadales bacterium]|nr:EAL domain-containing protein [Desulfuromonadales bacterium]
MSENTDQQSGGLVLIIDDDPMILILAREALEKEGFVVEEASDGSRVLSMFSRLQPDIVLLDVMLPGIDGFTVCRQIREHPEGKNTPVLMMTGLDDIESIKRAYDSGATDFISKPFNWFVLGYRVRYMLRASRTLHALDSSRVSLSYAQRIARLGSWEWNVENDRMHWSDAVNEIFNVDPQDLDKSYQAFLNFVHPLDKELVSSAIEGALTNNKPYSIDHQILLPDGSERFVHSEAEVIADKNGKPVRMSGIMQDITERKEAEKRIKDLAYYDSLTGLPNRILFKENLEHALAHAERKNTKVATLFLDLDRFKWINDTMGHSVGDLLLQAFAGRLKNTVRKSDSITHDNLSQSSYSIARLGGDEFTIILDDINRAQDAAIVARRILEETSQLFVIDGHEVFVTASIGISIFPDDGNDIVTLIKYADTAMYHAKDLGKNHFQFYSSDMTDNAFKFLLLENQLHHAMERNEFEVHYQPQVDMLSGEVICVEALIRWQNPELGMISPATFIPLAEEIGLIVRIDEWVLTSVCRQIKAWEKDGLPPVRVAVNLSGQNFMQKNLSDRISTILTATGVSPDRLELELTEGVLMRDGKETITTLDELKGMGLSLAIDDFGTGYSSLSYLKRFRLDTLKIDRSFIKDIASDSDSEAIVAAIVSLADSMKLRIIAEGVETVEQLTFLCGLQCNRMQGFLFDRPMTSSNMSSLLREGKNYSGRLHMDA